MRTRRQRSNAREPAVSETRSRTMRAIRKRDTKPELKVRRQLHAMGLRFRLHRSDLPGSPDIVLPRHRAVVLVHGCFWHQHPGCRHGNTPRVRTRYWIPKLARNVARDKRTIDALRALGWRTLVIWECELANPDAVADRLRGFIHQEPPPAAAPRLLSPYRFPGGRHAVRARPGTSAARAPPGMAEEARPAPAGAPARARPKRAN